MKSGKRIWELQSSTVCKVLGMAFHFKDLKKIARKFGIENNDPFMDEEFALHTTLVQLCGRDNVVSRHTEKMLERRFSIHGKRIPLDEPARLIRSLRESFHEPDAPLWAVVWGLATRGGLGDERIETALFGFIHMTEHRLLRERSKALRSEACGEVGDTDKDEEILTLKRDLLDMQWANRRLEKLVEGMKNRLDASIAERPVQERIPEPDIAPVRACRCANARKIRDLKALLDQAKFCNYELEAENARLRDEIDALVQEVKSYEEQIDERREAVSAKYCGCPMRLRGKKITLVGGIESLECHYRSLIESFGGQFRRHDGDCNSGSQALEDCITGSDLVVCPVEVNSHNAAKSVKRICKAGGVECCFPRSASITGLRRAIEEHCSDVNAA